MRSLLPENLLRRLARTTPLVALSLLSTHASAGGPFNLLVSAKNPVASLSASEVKRLVSGATKTWASGAGVVQLGIIPGEAPETVYLASMLETTPRELISMIQQQVFKGELRRPVSLRSPTDCAALVSANTGAFCIASASAPVPDTARIVPVQ
jgi:hypothetical protein